MESLFGIIRNPSSEINNIVSYDLI